MKKSTIGWILVVAGIAMLVISLAADFLGVGRDPINFGWKQILGATVSVIILLTGIFTLTRNTTRMK
jgi:uncharacterized membrane protein